MAKESAWVVTKKPGMSRVLIASRSSVMLCGARFPAAYFRFSIKVARQAAGTAPAGGMPAMAGSRFYAETGQPTGNQNRRLPHRIEAVSSTSADRTGWLVRGSGSGRREPVSVGHVLPDGGIITVVEYDGDEHYRHSLKLKADRAKDEIARKQGCKVVRFPYWIQLDNLTLQHYFGLEAEIEQSFPHGFITTKLFPASFCELGVERFRAELLALPGSVRDAVQWSLRERAAEHGLPYVLP